MVKALQYKRFGQPEVLELVDLLTLEPKTDEVSIKVSHVGLNLLLMILLDKLTKSVQK